MKKRDDKDDKDSIWTDINTAYVCTIIAIAIAAFGIAIEQVRKGSNYTWKKIHMQNSL